MATRVLVALGSNIGNREANVKEAFEALRELADGPVEVSSIYLTDPQDMEDDAEEFANAAASFRTVLGPLALLDALQAIEVDMGRPRDHSRNVSRTIDLDIIIYGDEVIADARLQVPHPRAAERRFVLMPLMEIGAEEMINGKTVADHLARLVAT